MGSWFIAVKAELYIMCLCLHTDLYIQIYVRMLPLSSCLSFSKFISKKIRQTPTHGALNRCFDLIRSHHQCTPWSQSLEIEPTTTVCRSRNTTTGPRVHATYKRSRLTRHGKLRDHTAGLTCTSADVKRWHIGNSSWYGRLIFFANPCNMRLIFLNVCT